MNSYDRFELLKPLLKKSDSKIVMLIMDGLGGLPRGKGGPTELETARTPNLDALASEAVCGLQTPVRNGITPGSGPAHLGLFGYDSLTYDVGRGVLSALGIGFDLKKDDVAARGNFCTLDGSGNISDRRAGRLDTETNKKLCALLGKIKLPGVKLFAEPEKDYRFLFVIRGKGLSGDVSETDPQVTGEPPRDPKGIDTKSKKTAKLIQAYVKEARKILNNQDRGNMILLRGFSQRPDWPLFPDVFGVRAASIAAYPMYRGVTRLLGMDILETPDNLASEFDVLADNWDKYDFFYVHVKKTDSLGEDGNFDGKVKLIEEVDALIPRIRKLNPGVIVVTGDHSTPAVLKSHSWHPVPLLVWSEICRPDKVTEFGERPCANGALGANFPSVDIMPMALSNAGRLVKFGA